MVQHFRAKELSDRSTGLFPATVPFDPCQPTASLAPDDQVVPQPGGHSRLRSKGKWMGVWHIYKGHIHVFLITRDKRNDVVETEVDINSPAAEVCLPGMKRT